MKKILYSLPSMFAASAFLIACAHSDPNTAAVPTYVPADASTPTNLPPDHNCYIYQGSHCVAPKTSLAADASCSVYNGSICVVPRVHSAPDATCAEYQGATCVAPILQR